MFFGEKCFKAPNGGLFCYSKFENLALKKVPSFRAFLGL